MPELTYTQVLEPKRKWRCRIMGCAWRQRDFLLRWSFTRPVIEEWIEHQRIIKGAACKRCHGTHIPTVSIPFDSPGGYIDGITLEMIDE